MSKSHLSMERWGQRYHRRRNDGRHHRPYLSAASTSTVVSGDGEHLTSNASMFLTGDDTVCMMISTMKKRPRNSRERQRKSIPCFGTTALTILCLLQSTNILGVSGSLPPWAGGGKRKEGGSLSFLPNLLSSSFLKEKKQNKKNRSRYTHTEREASSTTEARQPIDDDSDNYNDESSSTRDVKIQRIIEPSGYGQINNYSPKSVSIAIAPAAYVRNLRRGWSFRLPEWLTSPPPDIVDRLAIFARGIALGILAYEIIKIVRDIVKEALDELDMDRDGGGGVGFPNSLLGGSSQSLVSPKDARKVVDWLDVGRHNGEDLPNVSPSWIIQVAQNLHSYRNLPSSQLERILCGLTRLEASILEECLLRSDSHRDTFESVGGLFSAKATIFQWLSSFKLPPPQTSPSVSSKTAAATTTLKSNKKMNEISVPHYMQLQHSQSPYTRLLQRDSPSGLDRLNGMILWGPPGCGKSLLIRAISNQVGLPTLIITPSLVQRKWYGESTNRIRALFGLIDKLGSVCVVLDEVDGLMRTRNENDHEASREVKTEWLQWWDGVASSFSSSSSSSSPSSLAGRRKCLVVAATNHPWDVDIAAWRRFQHRIFVGLPNLQDRADLLMKWTADLPPIDPSVLQYVVSATEGYSPSDLFKFLQSAVRNGPVLRNDDSAPLNIGDFQTVLSQFKPTQLAQQYAQKLRSFIGSHGLPTSTDAPGVQHTFDEQWMPSFSGHVSSSTTEQSLVWNTPWGNYYKFSVPVDAEVIDALDQMLWTWNDMETGQNDADYDADDDCSDDTDDFDDFDGDL